MPLTKVSETDPDSEGALIGGVLAGDEASFVMLYRSQTPALYRLALSLMAGSQFDADDLVQETWLRAVAGLSRFERRSSIRSWLSSIAVRCAHERYRSSKRAADGVQPRPTPGRGGERASLRLDLERAIEGLSLGYRTVLLLHDLEGFTHQEIASLLGISAGTSKSQLSRARQRIREALGDEYATE